MYDLMQTALTATIEAIATIGVTGIIAHAFYSHHCKWMREYCPPVGQPQAEQAVEVAQPPTPEPEIPGEVPEYIIESIAEILRPVPEFASVGAAAIDYSSMTSTQLRKECGLRRINWRSGGDGRKPMKKLEMINALR